MAGYLKILPVFIFVLPGIIAAALYQDVRSGQADSAYPLLVTRLLPIGFKGLVLAGMLAALMSSLASAFNSCSTLLTWDVYRKWRPNATEARLVFVGRVTSITPFATTEDIGVTTVQIQQRRVLLQVTEVFSGDVRPGEAGFIGAVGEEAGAVLHEE